MNQQITAGAQARTTQAKRKNDGQAGSRQRGAAASEPQPTIKTTLVPSCGWPTEASVPAKRTTRRAA